MGGGYNYLKYALFIFLFSLTVFSCSVVITFAAMSGGFENNFTVDYSASSSVLLDGESFNNALKAPEEKTFENADSSIKSIIFDYMMPEYDDIVANARVTTPVDQYSAGDILMYHVGDSVNGYDVYVLANDLILANPNCSRMFFWCLGVKSITFNNFSTSIAQNLYRMFSDCQNLQSLDVSNFDTRNVQRTTFMFEGCKVLKNLDVTNFETPNLIECRHMFSGCHSLMEIDVSSFFTDNVTNMSYMFNGCTSITTLDISNFVTAKVENMSSMFKECTNLTTIYVGRGWSTASIVYGGEMFTDSTNLVGGNGTVYDSNYIDYTYARVDVAETPGYLTSKDS